MSEGEHLVRVPCPWCDRTDIHGVADCLARLRGDVERLTRLVAQMREALQRVERLFVTIRLAPSADTLWKFIVSTDDQFHELHDRVCEVISAADALGAERAGKGE